MAEGKRAWYVLRAISGKEAKVKEVLDAAIRNTDLGNYVFQVLIPTEKVLTVRNGKKVVKENAKALVGKTVLVLAEGFDYTALTTHLLGSETPNPRAVCEDFYHQYDISGFTAEHEGAFITLYYRDNLAYAEPIHTTEFWLKTYLIFGAASLLCGWRLWKIYKG